MLWEGGGRTHVFVGFTRLVANLGSDSGAERHTFALRGASANRQIDEPTRRRRRLRRKREKKQKKQKATEEDTSTHRRTRHTENKSNVKRDTDTDTDTDCVQMMIM